MSAEPFDPLANNDGRGADGTGSQLHPEAIRHFGTGATRNVDVSKLDYEGFLSPLVLEAFARYMHKHRKQKDGSLRDSDNWQKGIPTQVYVKSLIRHTMDFWRLWRGGTVIDPDTGERAEAEDLACAIMFNVMGWLHEAISERMTKTPVGYGLMATVTAPDERYFTKRLTKEGQ